MKLPLDFSNHTDKAIWGYYRLVKQGEETPELINELLTLLNIAPAEIDLAINKIAITPSLDEGDLEASLRVAKIDLIVEHIDDLIGPVGLALTEIFPALYRTPQRWMPSNNDSTIVSDIIEDLYSIRHNQKPPSEQAEDALKILQKYQNKLFVATRASQRAIDVMNKKNLTHGESPPSINFT